MDEQNEVKATKKGSLLGKLFPYILFLALGAGIGIFTVQKQPVWFGLSKGQAQVQVEVDELVSKVGKLINLPSDERPTVATVTDASKVTEQPFFKNAKNEDKVLIYQKAQKAILYRPSENRIIEVGAVNINSQPVATPSPSSSPTSSERPRATSTPGSSPEASATPNQ